MKNPLSRLTPEIERAFAGALPDELNTHEIAFLVFKIYTSYTLTLPQAARVHEIALNHLHTVKSNSIDKRNPTDV